MKQLLTLAVAMFLAGFPATLRASSQDRNTAVEKEIRTLEAQRFQAMIQLDMASLNRILAEDLVYTHSGGFVDTKTSYLDSLKSGALKYESVDTDQVRVRVYGDT